MAPRDSPLEISGTTIIERMLRPSKLSLASKRLSSSASALRMASPLCMAVRRMVLLIRTEPVASPPRANDALTIFSRSSLPANITKPLSACGKTLKHPSSRLCSTSSSLSVRASVLLISRIARSLTSGLTPRRIVGTDLASIVVMIDDDSVASSSDESPGASCGIARVRRGSSRGISPLGRPGVLSSRSSLRAWKNCRTMSQIVTSSASFSGIRASIGVPLRNVRLRLRRSSRKKLPRRLRICACWRLTAALSSTISQLGCRPSTIRSPRNSSTCPGRLPLITCRKATIHGLSGWRIPAQEQRYFPARGARS